MTTLNRVQRPKNLRGQKINSITLKKIIEILGQNQFNNLIVINIYFIVDNTSY